MQIVQDYRSLHAIPEPDTRLFKTTSYIRQQLEPLGCRIFSPTEGSVCAFFDFGRKNSLAFRADTDALPIWENTGLPWRSQHPGMMHACGHDGHTAILLELARRVSRHPLPHNILLIFQPAEETGGGAQPLCRAGLLQRHRVRGCFALHLWPGLPKGQVFSRPGILMSRTQELTAVFTGKSAHIANYSQGADALAACCRFYTCAESLRDQTPFLLKFGMLQGGAAPNVICHRAILRGSLRTLCPSSQGRLAAALNILCRTAAKKHGCRGQLSLSQGYPPVRNDPGLWAQAQKLYPVHLQDRALMTGEDFSFYQQQTPGVYFLLGIGNTPALHSPEFAFDPQVLTAGAALFDCLASGIA